MRVLLVDDDVAVGLILSIGLPDAALLEAHSLAEARAVVAADGALDAIVVDRRLPDGDGLVTRAGADHCLSKPIEPDTLVGYVASVLDVPPGERRARRQSITEGATGEIDVRDEQAIDLTDESPAERGGGRRVWSRFRRHTS